MSDLLDLPESIEEDLLELPEIVEDLLELPEPPEGITRVRITGSNPIVTAPYGTELKEHPVCAVIQMGKFDEPRQPDTYVGEVNDLMDSLQDIETGLGQMASERFFYHLESWEESKDPISASAAIHSVMNMRAGFYRINTEDIYYVVFDTTPDGTLVKLGCHNKKTRGFETLVFDKEGLDKLREKAL